MFSRSLVNRAVLGAKRVWYGAGGEPITYGPHTLRYVPGTRPVRLKYRDSKSVTVSNDVMQIEYFLSQVSPGDFLLDVGANVGQYSVLFAALAGARGQTIAFEPNEGARSVLIRNLALNGFSGRVRVESVALFESTGFHRFYSRGSHSMASLERAGFGSDAQADDISENVVETVTLDDYLGDNDLGGPRWIKLDTEGAEISILRGARNTLAGGATVLCELHPYAWSAFGTSFEDLLSIVRQTGRTIRYLDPRNSITSGPCYGAVIIS